MGGELGSRQMEYGHPPGQASEEEPSSSGRRKRKPARSMSYDREAREPDGAACGAVVFLTDTAVHARAFQQVSRRGTVVLGGWQSLGGGCMQGWARRTRAS